MRRPFLLRLVEDYWGILLLLCLFLVLPALGHELGMDLNLLPILLGPPVDAIIDGIATLSGNG